MGALLACCRIGCQVAMLGIAGLLGMLLIGGINHWGESQIERSDAMVTAARDANDQEARLQIALLQARRNEKNFLLRRDQDSLALHAASIGAATPRRSKAWSERRGWSGCMRPTACRGNCATVCTPSRIDLGHWTRRPRGSRC